MGMYNPTIFNSQPNTKIKFYESNRSKRSTEEAAIEEVRDKDRLQKREAGDEEVEKEDGSAREARGWCDDSFGVFCMLFNAIKGPGERPSDRADGYPDVPGSCKCWKNDFF